MKDNAANHSSRKHRACHYMQNSLGKEKRNVRFPNGTQENDDYTHYK